MCAKSVKGHHRAARRLAWAALSLGLLSSLWWRTEIPVGGATPGPRKHKYVIMLTVSRDSSLEKTMDQEFLAALRRDTRTVGLNITRSGKPWYDTETCKGDPMCDRIAINADRRLLLITCNKNPEDKIPGPPCTAAAENRQEKCIETLPQDLPKALWNHSKAFHLGED